MKLTIGIQIKIYSINCYRFAQKIFTTLVYLTKARGLQGGCWQKESMTTSYNYNNKSKHRHKKRKVRFACDEIEKITRFKIIWTRQRLKIRKIGMQVGWFISSFNKYTKKLFTIQFKNYEKQLKNLWRQG